MTDFMDEHRNCDFERQELSDEVDAATLAKIKAETALDELNGNYRELLETCAAMKARAEKTHSLAQAMESPVLRALYQDVLRDVLREEVLSTYFPAERCNDALIAQAGRDACEITATRADLELLQLTTRPIPVGERLPEMETRELFGEMYSVSADVLIFDGGGWHVGWLHSSGIWADERNSSNLAPTHWRPMFARPNEVPDAGQAHAR